MHVETYHDLDIRRDRRGMLNFTAHFSIGPIRVVQLPKLDRGIARVDILAERARLV